MTDDQLNQTPGMKLFVLGHWELIIGNSHHLPLLIWRSERKLASLSGR